MQPRIASFARQMVRRPSLGLLLNLIGRPPWQRLPNDVPWTDRPDALDRVDSEEHEGRLSPPLAAHLRSWISDGYLVVDGAVSEHDIDGMNLALDALWEARLPRPGLTFYELRDAADAQARSLSHAALLRVPPLARRRLRDSSNWRTHNLHRYNFSALRLFRSLPLRQLASAIFSRPARAFASINFMYGSRQPLHQDMAVFHIYPHNFLIGAWIACEDISPEAGPLVFLPGSHRAPQFDGFVDYPQTNLRTVSPEVSARYDRYMEELAALHPRREFIAKKGQVLLWHGMVAHGGAEVGRPELTRRSFVVHYHSRHADRGNQVLGPFNWT